MSVTGYEISEIELSIKENIPEKTWLCEDCHLELSTSMNIGYGKRGVCQRCGATKHVVYMVDKGHIL